MVTVPKRAGAGSGGHWLAAACAVSLCLAPLAARAQQQQTPPTTTPGVTTPGTATPGSGTTAAADFQALNRSLQVERTLAQFFNANADKAYLTATPISNPGTGTGTGTDTGTTTPGTGTANPGTGTGTTNPAVDSGASSTLSASLSGGEEVPPTTSTGTGTATFNFNQDRTQLAYDVRVTGLTGPATAMHLHRGPRGQAGEIIYTLTTPDANGVATGSVAINAADVDLLLQGGFSINVHTEANPNGEIRGQVVVQQTTTPGEPTPGTTPGTTPVTTPATIDSLRAIVTEIRAGHNAHVATLEQALGTNAQPAATFQNLDAPTLQQFLTMAITLEDFAVSAHQGVIQAWLTSGTGLGTGTDAAQPGSAQSLLSTVVAVALADARYAGALRAYRRAASTADGGDPNLTLTEDGGAQNVARDATQVDQFLQQYIVTTGTGTGTGTTPTQPGTGTGTGTTPTPPSTGTGTTPTPPSTGTGTDAGTGTGTGTNPAPGTGAGPY
jgi:hypothetical protein